MAIPQTTVTNYQTLGYEGMQFNNELTEIRQYVNDYANVAMVSQGVLTNDAAGTYTATINGVPIAVTYAVSVENTVDLMVAAINASAFVNSVVLASKLNATTYRVTSRTAGTAHTHTGSATGGTNANTVTTTTANVAEEYGVPGRIVLVDPLVAGYAVRTPQWKMPRATHTVIQQVAGIILHSHEGRDPLQTDAEKFYPPNRVIPVMRKGVIIVKPEDAVTEETTPHYRYASGSGGTKLGAIRGTTDTSTAASLLGYARFLGACGAGGLVPMSIDLP